MGLTLQARSINWLRNCELRRKESRTAVQGLEVVLAAAGFAPQAALSLARLQRAVRHRFADSGLAAEVGRYRLADPGLAPEVASFRC